MYKTCSIFFIILHATMVSSVNVYCSCDAKQCDAHCKYVEHEDHGQCLQNIFDKDDSNLYCFCFPRPISDVRWRSNVMSCSIEISQTSIGHPYSNKARQTAIFTVVRNLVVRFTKDQNGRQYAALAVQEMSANASGKEATCTFGLAMMSSLLA